MTALVLLRHGESIWNRDNRFTGWTDVDLTEKGIVEAKIAGKMLLEHGFMFDVAYTSVLKRAIKTLWHVLDEMDLLWIPEIKSWKLNERHYGTLQGLNKSETASKYGEEQVKIWRRSYDIRPPMLTKTDERYPGNEIKYSRLQSAELPLAESLKDTVARVMPFWESTVMPDIAHGKKVIIAAHGNSLRALIKHLDNISDDEITELNIPTGIPLVYEFDVSNKPVNRYYIGDEDRIKEAMDMVAGQGKAK